MDLLAELRSLILRRAGRGPVLDGVTVARVDQPSPPSAVMAEPSVAIVASGRKRATLNGVPYDYGAGQYLVVSLDLPIVGQALEASRDEPYAVVSLRLRPSDIAPLLPSAPTPARAPGLAISDAPVELLDPVVRLLRAAEHPADLHVLGESYRREILWRLVTGEQGATVRQIGGSITPVARAVSWLREHYASPVSVDRLAALAGLSPSAFHRHFRAATSMTPVQYQKQIRLQAARSLLQSDPATVAAIAGRVGYRSASQFTRDYRRAFGTSPRA
ncbi:AraC family transcriptional regulator N-terminal domain-containing protein [Dactylosporangium sp. CS-047395]|uniref:AraC family transcriptional regulator n=1 Tax=Dactylosporangium sp. CS-047395 TaxID=3239936 RepID=UPI003D8DF35F